ncbi:MAG: type VII secretion protein EssC [Clostridiales bacterium]|nr:type VII secretion protein EssC [Clostridiales bacterium]
MAYQYKLIIQNKNAYKEFEIPEDMERVRAGTTTACEFRLNPDFFFGEIEILLERAEGWCASCSDRLYFSRGDIRKLYYTELEHGDMLSVCYAGSGEDAFSLYFLIDFEAEIPVYAWKTELPVAKSLEISDRIGADIELKSGFGKGTRILLMNTGNGAELVEDASPYGTFVNGRRISGKVLLGDACFFSVADFSAYYHSGWIWFSHRHIKTNRISELPDKLETDSTYPMFMRSTRVRSGCDQSKIRVLEPAIEPKKPEQNIATSLMPSIAMFALVVVLRSVLSTMGGTFVLFSICSMGLGAVTSIISIIDRRKKYKEDCEKRQTTYRSYVEKKREEIEKAREEELEALREQYYSTEQDLVNVVNFSSRLFDRMPEDDDFLDVYLGVGDKPAVREIDFKQQEKLEAGDDLSRMPEQLASEYRYLKDAPVTLRLREASAVGIIGSREKQYEFMKIILLDIVSRQYFGDVSLYVLLDGNTEQYGWIRLLPHIQGADRRNIVCDSESRNNVFEDLYKELTDRSNEEEQTGYNVIFVMGGHGIKSHPLSRFIENAADLNTVFLFFEDAGEKLPLHCRWIIETGDMGNEAALYTTSNSTERMEFSYKFVRDADIKKAVHVLAPVYCEEISLESSLRKSLTLFELLGIYGARDLDLESRWKQSKIYDSMAVPLGVNAKNEVVCLDIHEKSHGPHGLVAGTTGSGKSELLQTFILGAATLFHPYEIGFVIIDFKGGGMVNQFKDLPHLMGAITNIDGKAVDRSLKSIKAELLKRQELFAGAGVNHIDKYIRAYKEGKAGTALPHLVIIVDEFAELKAEQPEFMKELISTARIGRSLGVHLILATQKPAGQVNEQIWSNSKFKLCLKVQTQEDSNEVLKSPLAAEIREPGRAYLQVGNNEIFELLQSGFSGAPEKTDDGNQKSFDICALDFKGERRPVYRQRPKKSMGSRTQLEALVDYVNSYCRKMNILKLPDICLPELAEIIVFDSEKCCGARDVEMHMPVGVYDDPDHQYQGIAEVAVGTANTVIIGSSRYGKTNLLELIIRGLAESYSPEEVNIYIIDFASMVLRNFEGLVHVGGVVCPSDDERLKNLFRFLGDQVNLRREKLLSAGVSSFASYREAGYTDLPQIVLLIDNMTVLKDLYLQDCDVLLNLCREGVSVGISIIMTNAQTSGLGYKYMANFAERISLFCNEPGEYASLFGSCRMQPDEIPGRCLVEIEKSLYECQTFLAFEGEREIERVRNMRAFIESINDKYTDCRAIPIPEIPELLGEQYVFEHFPVDLDGSKQILGLSYATVSPRETDICRENMLCISGDEDHGRSNFIRYIMHSMARTWKCTDIFIFDDYRKKLQPLVVGLGKGDAHVTYNIGTDAVCETVCRLDIYFQRRYRDLVSGKEPDADWKILVINNEDIYAEICKDKAALAAFKNIVGKYKMLHIYVICAALPNAQVSFGSPEIYKMAKEMRNILYFDNLENLKLVDVPLAVVRANNKKISAGDAFYITGNECVRIKTPLAVK